jgi:hypothetical protein
VLDIEVPDVSKILAQAPGIVVICVWMIQAVLVAWTLARLGRCQRATADEKQPMEV